MFGDNAFSLPSSAKKMGYALMDRFAHHLLSLYCETGDALHSLRTNLQDPNNVLQSWDPTLVNPCTWFHVTCNNDNSEIRVDLGNATLSGQLVLQLGQLKNLQYLELYNNNISGPIPNDLGNLTNLVSLDLYLNRFSGPIPESLGKLSKLRFLGFDKQIISDWTALLSLLRTTWIYVAHHWASLSRGSSIFSSSCWPSHLQYLLVVLLRSQRKFFS
ncbi:hypothetical protein Fmac_019042 [Flemingia macrophylla]|uniref:Leucine-rich repeat-containing N-terminal plant-type domain-containing protein n=1 Tax=Flemingia macrophylla TaxID=520843 RepID=A0ABD1M6Q0_9FABA